MMRVISIATTLGCVAGKVLFPCPMPPTGTSMAAATDASVKRYETRLEMLADLIPKSGVIAEIGVWKGDLAEYIANTTRPRALHLIDPWPPGEEIISGDQDGQNLMSFAADELYAAVSQKFAGNPAVHIHRAFSQDILPRIPPASLDAVYVDGDHTEGGVLRDLLLCVCAVKPGGWIFGHDYEFNPAKAPEDYNFGVKRAVGRLLRITGYSIHALAYDGYVSFAIQRK